MDDLILKVSGISKSYRKNSVLSDISFSLKKGEIVGVLGKNGSGKSTLLDILALALKPDAGYIHIAGQDALKDGASIRPRIGYVPQDIALFEELTVRENLLCWTRAPLREARDRAYDISRRLNIHDFMDKKVSDLSGGMKRRVSFAVAFLEDRDLLVLDEPFSGVDVENMDLLIGFLREMASKGVSQLISSHSLDSIVSLADRIFVLKEGDLHSYDMKEDLLKASSLRDGPLLASDIIKGLL